MPIWLVVVWALALVVVFWRFRFHRPWWQVDVVASLTFLGAAVFVGTPAVGFADALWTGALFAIYVETCIVLAFAVRDWARRRFEQG